MASFTPENQAATFRNVDRLYATRNIARGTGVTALPPHARSMSGFRYSFEGASRTPEELMSRRRVSGLLVLKNGAVALERYGMGNTETSRWVSFSVAKSFTSTLVGAALHDGSLDSLDRRCETIVPALRGGGYEGATVRELLRMASGVQWNEEYGDAASDIVRFSQAALAGPAGAVLDFMRTRPRAAAPGTRFNYSTGETFVLGAIVTAVTGATLSDYLSARIWSRAGMESAAYWMIEAPNGQEMAGGVLSATLRDYGRFGLVVLRDGVIGSQRVLPAGWRNLAGWPDPSPTAFAGYGYQWWSLGTGVAFTGKGLHGQFLYLNPAEDVVAVVWGAWLQRQDAQAEAETFALITAAVDWLR
ncbi:MAG: beta-lactamase family protein [Rubrivivax sp.]|nr:beta-lactamase family protein [Rubrivivax sp.]